MNVTVQGKSIFVDEQGSGTPTLFLHGNPDSSILWRDVIAGMKSRFRCIAPDLPGFGHSDVPAGIKFSLDEMADFIDQLLIALKVSEPVNLVVHDFGGPFGLAWAVKHPQKVRAIAVMNTNFFSDYKWHYWARIWRTPVLGELSMMTMTWWPFHAAMRKSSPAMPEEHIRQTYERITPKMKKTALQLYRATNPKNYEGWEEQYLALAKRVPVCVLWGDRDPYIAPAYAERFGARTVWHFSENGHFLPVEAPREVAGRLLEFFT
jgi:pimeloyl-ACP methyl ester carboxylesterase